MAVRKWILSIFVAYVASLAFFIVYPMPVMSWALAKIFGAPSPIFSVERVPHIVQTEENIFLETLHFFPTEGDISQYPTVLSRTPYGIYTRQGLLGLFTEIGCYYLASMGYNVIAQNTRGRLNSTGEWEPLVHEHVDGIATLKWIKQQKWFNGKLGTNGVSYLGFTQFALLGNDAPIRPAAMAPSVTSTNFFAITHPGNTVDLSLMLIWHTMTHLTTQRPHPTWLAAFKDIFRLKSNITTEYLLRNVSTHVPIVEFDKAYVGEPIKAYRQMLLHTSNDDEYWSKADATENLKESDDGTIFMLGGWYDFFINETITNYFQLKSLGKHPRLTVLNVDHGKPQILFQFKHTLPWFEYKLKGINTLRSKPVLVQIAPDNDELELDSWPPTTKPTPLFIHPNGALDESEYTGSKATYHWKYDPTNPTPYIGGYQLENGGAVDNLPLITERHNIYNDTLILTASKPVPADLVIAGAPSARFFVSSSIQYNDFFVRLLDFDQKTSVNICDGFVRISPTIPAIHENEIYEVAINFYPTAYKVKHGHQIMLQVSSGAHPFRSRNPGTGENIQTATKFVTSHQTLHISPSHPSQITLPVLYFN